MYSCEGPWACPTSPSMPKGPTLLWKQSSHPPPRLGLLNALWEMQSISAYQPAARAHSKALRDYTFQQAEQTLGRSLGTRSPRRGRNLPMGSLLGGACIAIGYGGEWEAGSAE